MYKDNVSTWMNEVNLESFFCLVLMISRAKGWLLQNVPTACLIFSSPPLNCNHHTQDGTESRRTEQRHQTLGRSRSGGVWLPWKCLVFNHYNERYLPEGGQA